MSKFSKSANVSIFSQAENRLFQAANHLSQINKCIFEPARRFLPGKQSPLLRQSAVFSRSGKQKNICTKFYLSTDVFIIFFTVSQTSEISELFYTASNTVSMQTGISSPFQILFVHKSVQSPLYFLSPRYAFAAPIKSRNNGCARFGRDRSSGWN